MIISSFRFGAKPAFLKAFLLLLFSPYQILAAPCPGQSDGARSQFRSIRFEEELSIFQEDWFPTAIYVDYEKHIHVLSSPSRKEQTFIEFDPQGKEISRRQIVRGQAPGEFGDFAPAFTRDGRIFVADWPLRRLTILDKSFKIEKIVKLDLYGDRFGLDSKGNRYFLAYKASKMRSRNQVVLTKCDPDGKILEEYASYDWGPREKGDGTYEADLFQTQMKYAIDESDRLYYAFSNKYEVQIIDPDGPLHRTISRDIKPRKVTQEDLDKRLPAESGRVVVKYMVPERVPFIADIFPLPKGYLLVVTFEKSEDLAHLAGDLIDDSGDFVARVKVPRYYNWDFLLAPLRSRALCSGDNFSAIESDAEEEKFWVKRYRIIWE